MYMLKNMHIYRTEIQIYIKQKKTISTKRPLQNASSWWFQPSWKIWVKLGIFRKEW